MDYSYYLFPGLADTIGPCWKVSLLHLSRICPGSVAAMGEGHVPCPHIIECSQYRQAAPYSMARLHSYHAGYLPRLPGSFYVSCTNSPLKIIRVPAKVTNKVNTQDL